MFWHSPELPDLQSAAQGVLHNILRQRKIVDNKYPSQGGYHPPRLVPEEIVEGVAPRRVTTARLAQDWIARRRAHRSHLHDRPYLYGAVTLEDRAAFGQLRRLRQVAGLDEAVT